MKSIFFTAFLFYFFQIFYFKEKLFIVYKFLHCFRYLDDILVLIASNSDFSSLLCLINSIDPCIHFTLEVENDNSHSFLDVLVSKHIDRFSTTVCRKSFSFSLPPHALTNHPHNQKMAVFYIFIYCASQIYSDPSDFFNELNYLKSLTLSRVYNISVIDKVLDKFKNPKCSVCQTDSCLNIVYILPSLSKFLKSFHNLTSTSRLNL